ncbi:MAG: S8 family serine peptidase [Actinobacteria bacterium]|nr:S8 family serine peptidase [Actinomycetota bacterium]
MTVRSTVAFVLAAVLTVAAAPAVGAGASPDPLSGLQWGLDQVRAPRAWSATSGAGVVVAVVDTGVDLGHPDLDGKVVGGATFAGCPDQAGGCGNGDWLDGEPASPHESAGHGTHVAGIVAAATGNGHGIAAVAPDAGILSVKVLRAGSHTATGSVQEIAAGVRWAVDNGAHVINLSLGALPLVGRSATLRDAVTEAAGRGVVVVAAAGNDTLPLCAEPASDPAVICVVATDRREQRAIYSSGGLDAGLNVVAAPGGEPLLCSEGIVSTWPGQLPSRCSLDRGYQYWTGTSMAAPHVAGVAALLLAQGRPAGAVIEVLKVTARTPLTDQRGVYTPVYGYGIVDAAAAVAVPVGRTRVVERHAGPERIATAAAVSRRTHARAGTVVVARADVYADALVGAPLAAHIGGPLLLTGHDRLAAATAAEIDRLGASRAVLLGGERALSGQVARDLAARGLTVRRVAGPDRYATAAAIAAELPRGGEVFVVEGAHPDPARGWPDALSASGLAGAHRRPVLLVTRDSVPPPTAQAIGSDQDATIVGGSASVSDAVAGELDRRARTVRRLAGPDRYGTSAAVIREAEARGISLATTWLATGRSFPDGLAAGAAAGGAGGVLLLIDGHDLDASPASRDLIGDRAARFRHVLLAGGVAAITSDTEARLRRLVEG